MSNRWLRALYLTVTCSREEPISFHKKEEKINSGIFFPQKYLPPLPPPKFWVWLRPCFLGVFGFHVVLEYLCFFLSISYYAGSLWLTSFCILAAFFTKWDVSQCLWLVAVFSYLQGLIGFKSLQKNQTLVQSSEAHILTQFMQLTDCIIFSFKKAFGLQYIIWHILFVELQPKLKKNTKWPTRHV